MAIRNPKLTFKKSMVWEQEIEELIKSKIVGKSLNVCCGESKIGDVRVDIDPAMKPDIVADMNELPFEENSFDTVISDPVWKLNYYKRMKPFFECVRVCKVGGRIIYNATWIPTSKCVELEEIYVRQSAQFGNVSVVCIFKKTKDISEM